MRGNILYRLINSGILQSAQFYLFRWLFWRTPSTLKLLNQVRPRIDEICKCIYSVCSFQWFNCLPHQRNQCSKARLTMNKVTMLSPLFYWLKVFFNIIIFFRSKQNTTQTLISISIKISIGLNALSLPIWHSTTFDFFFKFNEIFSGNWKCWQYQYGTCNSRLNWKRGGGGGETVL